MSIKINYKGDFSTKLSGNLVLFANEKFNIKNLSKYIPDTEFSYINDLLKNSDLKKDLLVFEVNSKRKIILISIKPNLKSSEIENRCVAREIQTLTNRQQIELPYDLLENGHACIAEIFDLVFYNNQHPFLKTFLNLYQEHCQWQSLHN